MKSVLLVLLLSLLRSDATQKVEGSLDSLIEELFQPRNETKAEGDAVEHVSLDGFALINETNTETANTAEPKCGEGEDKGIHKCVHYYMCSSGDTADDGITDLRFQDDRTTVGIHCDHYLDVCCKISYVQENQ